MKKIAFIAALLTHSPFVFAATKYLDCVMSSSNGEKQVFYIKIEDESPKAELQWKCKVKSCPIRIYKKEVLPTSIRLSQETSGGQFKMTITMDIDKETLSLTNTQVLQYPNVEPSEILSQGTCKVR